MTYPQSYLKRGRWRLAAIIAALCAALAVACSHGPPARSARPGVFATAVTVDTSGRIAGGLNSHYLGLSFESGSLDSGKFRDAGDLALLLKNLGSGVLRFGGNSVDQKGFTGVSTSVLAGLGALADTSGWSVLYSENLGTFSAAAGRAVTAATENVRTVLGRHLTALACGNEPDLYSANGLRPSGYSEGEYLAESAACLGAIRAGAPGVILAGPDTSGTGWLAAYAAREAGQVGWLDQHYYALGCAAGRSTDQLADALLSPEQTADEVTMFGAADAAARTAGAHLQISETNTASCGGIAGLSDAYVSALWAVDYLLTGAEHGVYGMDFHGGLGSSCQLYTPLCQVGADQYAAQPLYYGMLFTHLLGTGHLLPVTVSTGSAAAHVAAFALRPLTGGGLRLVVENLSGYQTTAALHVGGQARSARVLHLTGPSLLSTSGVSIQGATVARDGSFAPGKPSTARCAAGACAVTVAPYSAVLVSVR